ncbi:alpha/beta hydrolase [Pseudonocardia sp. CNS-139]|nr:alpha/beta hydrolase [Pseudonocardia sp. CNS-139]
MTDLPLPSGVRSAFAETARMRTHYLESGPADGAPVVLVHGNLSTGRFFEHLMPGLAGHRVLAPDMRCFGDSAPLPLDATRGLADWADDVAALLDTLGITQPPHLVGWSTAGAAIVDYAKQRPVASLTFLDPVSPFGYGGALADGSPVYPDYAGSGAGTGNPEVVRRIAEGDASAESPASIRNVMNAFYFAPAHREPPEREDMFVAEILKTVTGEANYPGDVVASENWPGAAPGTSGILNALSPKYCNWSGIVGLDPKPPVLWTHGSEDIVVSDASPLDLGTIGPSGAIPGWPGAEVFPSQPMVTQIRAVLAEYAAAGGSVRTEMFAGCGHSPHLEAADKWLAVFTDFLATA